MQPNEINELKSQLADLQSRLHQLESTDLAARSDRRGMLKLAAGAAAGALAGAVALNSESVSAGSTTPVYAFYYPLTPARVYDSRWTNAGSGIAASKLGRLTNNTSRVVDVTRARSSSGTVTNSDFLPQAWGLGGSYKVMAISFNLTVADPTGMNYLSVSTGSSSTTPTTSSINFVANQNIANYCISPVSWNATSRGTIGDYSLKIWCGDDVGACNFIIDVTGFYVNTDSGIPSPWSAS